MSAVAQSLRQVRFTNKAFWRNPAAAFFTFVFPLMFLVIFTTLFGNEEVPVPGTDPLVWVAQSTYYVPAMAAFAVITACYTNLAISVAFQRDGGILKRTRGTPLPSSAYLAGRAIHAVLMAAILVSITLAFGAALYETDLPTGVTLARFVLTVLIGSAAFSALGLAVTAIIPNADAAPPIVNVTILPILFLSDIFIPVGTDPAAWVDWVGKIFPVRHFAEAMQAAFLGRPFEWADLVVVGAWGLAGLILAARFFTWEPRK